MKYIRLVIAVNDDDEELARLDLDYYIEEAATVQGAYVDQAYYTNREEAVQFDNVDGDSIGDIVVGEVVTP